MRRPIRRAGPAFQLQAAVVVAGIGGLALASRAGNTSYLPLGIHLGNNLAGRALDGALGPGGRSGPAEDEVAWTRTALLVAAAAVAAYLLSRRRDPGASAGAPPAGDPVAH